jgi:uncharacterized membrane-anchored protein
MNLPPDHPQRFELHNEVHARPPESLTPPQRLSYLALLANWTHREQQWRSIASLAERFNVTPPPPAANYFSADLGPFRIKWERHTEFARYKIIVPGVPDDPFASPAITAVPPDWLAQLPGQIVMATHVALLSAAAGAAPDTDAISRRLFAGNTLIGAAIAGGLGTALTDFRIHEDGFGRVLVHDHGMTPRQAGRMIQRLLEIETYRMLALLAFPVARELGPTLTKWERELAEITRVMVRAGENDEAALLERLTGLAAEIENSEADNDYRFSAAAAYYELVQRRIAELREERIQGLQTFHEFMERRLAPAMNTCRAAAARQESLSERVSRATQLLSTRVDITREGQTHALLESMNRRAKLQLRLQETVEGLSVAAVTYYIVGLVGYAAKAIKALGAPVNPDVAMGIAIPVVAVLVALGVRKIRKLVTRTV